MYNINARTFFRKRYSFALIMQSDINIYINRDEISLDVREYVMLFTTTNIFKS